MKYAHVWGGDKMPQDRKQDYIALYHQNDVLQMTVKMMADSMANAWMCPKKDCDHADEAKPDCGKCIMEFYVKWAGKRVPG